MVFTSNPAAALVVEAQSWRWGYAGLANNCLDQTTRILRAFGASSSQIPLVGDDWTPRAWFQAKMPGGSGTFLPGRDSTFG